MNEHEDEFRTIRTTSLEEAVKYWIGDVEHEERLLKPLMEATGWLRAELLLLKVVRQLEWLGATPKRPQEPWEQGEDLPG